MRALRQAFRTLFKAPFVTAVAILSIALGIGANAAIYSLLDQMLLRALPVNEPERLVNLSSPGPKPGSQSCNQAGGCETVFSHAMFRDLEKSRTAFTGIGAHRLFGTNLAWQGQTLNGEGLFVSGSYFALLGLRPALGRLLGPADDETVGAHFVAVLSHSFWQTQLGGRTDVIDTEIVVNGRVFTVVGIAPRGFAGTTLGGQPHVYVPLTMRGVLEPWFRGYENRRDYWIYLFARLQPGQSIERAAAAVNAVYGPIINDVEAPLQQGMSEQTLEQFRAKRIVLEDGRRGQSSVHDEVSTPITLLFATTGIVLLIACANIANLLLARGASRRMETAVRLSLGASRRRIVAQLLTESILLALMGGLASLFVARWTLALIGSILPAEASGTLRLALNPAVILFTAVLSVGTGLLFGLFPALHSTRPDLVTTIRSNAGNIAGARAATRFRAALVTLQIAMSMALLISAGLFLRSLVNVSRVDLGLRTDNMVTFGISPQLNGYDIARSKVLFARAEETLAAIPGVSAVTASLVAVLAGNNWGSDVSVQGFERGPDTDANASFNEIGPAYFQTLGIPLLAGREFTVADNEGSLDVAIVNEAFARKFNLGRDAVGKWMAVGGDSLDTQIVGLVQNAKYSEVKDEVPPLFFVPYRQDLPIGTLTFYLRATADPATVLRAVPAAIRSLDPNLPVENLKLLSQQVRENVFLDRMISMMSAAFAALATVLAAVGLYGVLAYSVAQRTREIGVQMALGADGARVRGMIMRQVVRMLVLGGVIGLAVALALGRAARSLLFGLQSHDPLVIGGASLVLTLFALLAGFIPAWRASRVHPMRALRYE